MLSPRTSARSSSQNVIEKIERGSKQTKLSDDVEVNVFVLLNSETAKTPRLVTRRNGRVGSATVTLAELAELEQNPSIQSIELGETLRVPDPQVGLVTPAKAPERHAALNTGNITLGGNTTTLEQVGENVLIGIIDVGGIDFAHEDFMDDQGNSRILRIWDQGGDAFDPPRLTVTEAGSGKSTGYGSEITAEHIAFALKEAAAARVSPYDLAPQSQAESGARMQPMWRASRRAVRESASGPRSRPC